MVSTALRFSTVVPGTLRGGETEEIPLSGLDIAFKLHYVRGIYVFASPRVTIRELKDAMFYLLNRFFGAAGRVRWSDDERLFLKCNDAGVRIVEAFSDQTVNEWLDCYEVNDGFDHHHDGLCYDAVLGPDLAFSPLVYVQFTQFKCGGLSVGLSWAHILGGVQSASAFMNSWAQLMAGHVLHEPIHVPQSEKYQDTKQSTISEKAMSLKELESVGKHWLLTTKSLKNMRTHSFSVTSKQLEALRSDTNLGYNKFSSFEIISAMIWKSLSNIGENKAGSEIATICSFDYSCCQKLDKIPNNESMKVSIVEADPRAHNISELAYKIANEKKNENDVIDDVVARNNGKVDFFVYGANLTFVDLENVDICGVELRGEKPCFASFAIGGVGEKGAIMVMPFADDKIVTLVLPQDQLVCLKGELKKQWNFLE